MALVYSPYVSSHPVRRSSTAVRSGAQSLRAGDEGVEAPGDSGRQVRAVGDGVVVAEAEPRHGAVGALGEVLWSRSRDNADGVGRVADGCRPFGLERGDGGVDGGADRACPRAATAAAAPRPGRC